MLKRGSELWCYTLNSIDAELRVFFAVRVSFRIARRGESSLRLIKVLESQQNNSFLRRRRHAGVRPLRYRRQDGRVFLYAFGHA
jgi:hypothetical protein